LACSIAVNAAGPLVTYSSKDISYADAQASTQSNCFRAERLQWKTVRAYFIGCISTVVGCYAIIALGLLFLRATDNLPPPIITNNLCFDEKLRWISGELPATSPDLLVFGSSVAWRHFDGNEAVQSGLAKIPYNLGFCGSRLGQTAILIKYFLSKENFSTPRRALLIASPQDFENCAGPEQQTFSTQDADEALFSSVGTLALYLRNIDFVPLVRNAMVIKDKRRGTIPLDSFIFTKNGDGPLDTNESRRDLLYGQIAEFEQNCFSALRDITEEFAQRKIEFVLLLSPIHPRWLSEYDPDRQTMQELRSRIARTLKGTHFRVWDASESKLFSESDFIDAVHLRWSAVKRLTNAMVDFARKSSVQ
jgi:hypothetical protein